MGLAGRMIEERGRTQFPILLPRVFAITALQCQTEVTNLVVHMTRNAKMRDVCRFRQDRSGDLLSSQNTTPKLGGPCSFEIVPPSCVPCAEIITLGWGG